MNEINELREEIAKLRERVAVLENLALKQAPPITFDWHQPLRVGTPQWVNAGAITPGTIVG